MNIKAEQLLLYAVSERREESYEDFLRRTESLLENGVTCLQLREKRLSDEAFKTLAAKVLLLCRRFSVPLIINDRFRLALAIGADGVHVGIDDCPVAEIRRQAGKNFVIGATAKTIEQARRAEKDGADYLGVGALFPSETKPEAIRISHEMLRAVCSAVSIPAVAIGGISEHNVLSLKDSGISGIAVSSALYAAKDPGRAALRLKKLAREATGAVSKY